MDYSLTVQGLPTGWNLRTVGSVCRDTEIVDPARTPKRVFRYIDVSAVSNRTFEIAGSTEHTGATAPSRARKRILRGDVLFATVRPTLRRVALVPEELDGQIASTAFCVCRVDPRYADSYFVYYSLLGDHFADALGRIERGANYPAVTDADVKGQQIPLPPVPEQQAIGRVLKQLQMAVRMQHEVVNSLNDLKAATLAKLFAEGLDGGASRTTPYGDVPASWRNRSLDECATIQTGIAKGKKIAGPTVERPYLRVANVQDGYLDLTEIKTIELRQEEVQRYLLQDGDVLLTEGGDFDKLGRGYVWRNQIESCVHQNHIFAVRTNRDFLLPEFLAHQVQSPYGKAYFLNVAHKTTNLACINSSKLKEFHVLVPSMTEQARIAGAVNAIDAAISAAVAKRDRFQLLFEESLRALMGGSLRVTRLLNA